MKGKKNKTEEYQYFKDQRSAQERLHAIRLTHALTQRNLERIKWNSAQQDLGVKKSITKFDILYVCLHGVPPIKGEFDVLKLPGQVLVHHIYQQQESVGDISLRKEAQYVHKMIEKCSKTKPIVFVNHSFGTIVLSTYFTMYSTDRVIGIIDIGGVPITMYPIIRKLLNFFGDTTPQEMIESIDSLYSKYRSGRVEQFPILPYQDFKKEHFLKFLLLVRRNEPFSNLFSIQRKWPKILKCFIYGRKDAILNEELLSEKAVHYAYVDKFEESYDSKLRDAWRRRYKKDCGSVQQNFIYSFQGGAHSVHIQKKFRQLIPKIVDEYLSFLESAFSFSSAKI